MKPNRRNDIRVDLLAHLTAAHSMLETAYEKKMSPNKTMGSDKMFETMLEDMKKSMERARKQIYSE